MACRVNGCDVRGLHNHTGCNACGERHVVDMYERGNDSCAFCGEQLCGACMSSTKCDEHKEHVAESVTGPRREAA